jgi:Helicase conserved C-terminal domain
LTQEVFFWLCEQGGKVQMTEVRSHVTARTQTQGAFLSVISTLESCALAFDTFTGDGTRWLFTPADLLTRVEHEVQERAEEEQRFVFCPVDETEVGHESQPLLLYDLATVIGISTQMIIEPTKDNRLPKRLRGKIRPLLHGRARLGGDSWDDIYMDQIFRTAHRMGLLELAAPAEEEKRRYLRGPKLGSWSDLSPREQAQAFLQWWRATPNWADLRSDGKLLYSSTTDHEQLLNQLKHCVPERWYRMEVLFYALFRERPLPLFNSYTTEFIRPVPLRSQREIWMEGEAETYRGPLTSFLSELGIVSVKQQPLAEQEGTEDLFCITAFGAAVLGSIPVPSDPSAQATEQPTLILQPNFEVLVMPFDTRLVYQLLPTAEPLGIGRVSTFRLTQSALLTGLRNGVHLEELLTFLAAHTPQKTLPQNVVYTLKDWAKTYREFHLSEAFLIETPENETADSLRRLLGNLPIELRQIELGSFLVLPKTHLTFGDLRKRLRKAGIEIRGEPLSV